MPKISEMLLNLDLFQYATSLDLSMDYYHIRISKEARKNMDHYPNTGKV